MNRALYVVAIFACNGSSKAQLKVQAEDQPRTTKNSLVLKAIDANGDGVTSVDEVSNFLINNKGKTPTEWAENAIRDRGETFTPPVSLAQPVMKQYDDFLQSREHSHEFPTQLGVRFFKWSDEMKPASPVSSFMESHDRVEASPNAILAWIAEAPELRGDMFPRPGNDGGDSGDRESSKKYDSFADQLGTVGHTAELFVSGVLRRYGKWIEPVTKNIGPLASYISFPERIGQGIEVYGGLNGFVIGSTRAVYDLASSTLALAIATPVEGAAIATGSAVGATNPLLGALIAGAGMYGGWKLSNHVKAGFDDTFDVAIGPALTDLLGATVKTQPGTERPSKDGEGKAKGQYLNLKELAKLLLELPGLELEADKATKAYEDAKKAWDSDPGNWSNHGGIKGIKQAPSGHRIWDLQRLQNQCNRSHFLKSQALLRTLAAAVTPKPKIIKQGYPPYSSSDWFKKEYESNELGRREFDKHYTWSPGVWHGPGERFAELAFYLHEAFKAEEIRFYVE